MVSVLESKKAKTTRFKANISPALSGRLEKLQERIKAEAPDTHLNTDAIVEKALESAVRRANKELDGKQ